MYILSISLKAITDSNERAKLIDIARNVNMNVQAITLNIVENLSRTNENDLSMTLTDATFIKNKSEFITFKPIQSLNEVTFILQFICSM